MDVGWFALAVSSLALALAGWTTWRATRKDRVFWVQHDKVTMSGGRARHWRITISNYGHGVAGDVRTYVSHQFSTEQDELDFRPTLGLGAEVSAVVPTVDLSNQTLETLTVTVMWRQAPSFERERTQTFRFPMKYRHDEKGA